MLRPAVEARGAPAPENTDKVGRLDVPRPADRARCPQSGVGCDSTHSRAPHAHSQVHDPAIDDEPKKRE
eukprot:1391878-Rhodomonas_salina.1